MAKTNKKTKKKKKCAGYEESGINRQFYPRTKKELIDFDYLNKLSDKERQWLSSFMNEWAKAYLTHPQKKIHKKRKYKKIIYDANNARNRDMWNKFSRVYPKENIPIYTLLDSICNKDNVQLDYEDRLIEFIDYKNNKK
ncbi:MAG: hypothetical protein RML94_01770 [Bacteroidia bacterium]|nr:hypothetical protein [Bacteroidia bacterium]